MRFYGMAVMAIICFPIIFPEYIVEVLTIADFKPLAWVASMARIYINRELIRVIEQYDSRSQERLSHQAP
ncbi:hypothetical protein L0F63_005880 [Massospora cicadina]|nr:hypothetical protein L0F63_005880 [Massospora cicadina]